MAADSLPDSTRRPRGRTALLLTAGLAVLAFALVLLVARAAGPVDSATIALATCGAALVYALRRMYAMVRALARPDALAQVGRGAGHFSQAELREEKRRLLRAIKELEFDHGMGKLSPADFEAVIGTYRLRAIEVMRALEGGGDLHPELQKLLAEREAPAPVPVPVPKVAEISSPDLDRTSRICGQCTGHNENDAKFCKHCGVALARNKGDGRALRGGSAASGEIGA